MQKCTSTSYVCMKGHAPAFQHTVPNWLSIPTHPPTSASLSIAIERQLGTVSTEKKNKYNNHTDDYGLQ